MATLTPVEQRLVTAIEDVHYKAFQGCLLVNLIAIDVALPEKQGGDPAAAIQESIERLRLLMRDDCSMPESVRGYFSEAACAPMIEFEGIEGPNAHSVAYHVIENVLRWADLGADLNRAAGPIPATDCNMLCAHLEQEIDAVRVRLDYIPDDLGLASHERTADSKADSKKNSDEGIPENPDVLRLALLIRRNTDPTRKRIHIAREFVEGDEIQAKSLLRSLRRYPQLLNQPDTADG